MGNDKNISCGGSLVTDTTILTAAHCVDNWKRITTFCGSLRKWRGQSREVIKVVMPKAYKGANNDLALLTVSEPVDLHEGCGPVSLPNKGSPMCKDGEGTLSGWGRIQEKPAVSTRDLQRAERTIIPLEECGILRKVSRKYRQDLDSVLCVKAHPTISGCVGDSGSGLVKTIGGVSTVVGVASWGVGCSREGIYGNVCHFVNTSQKFVEIPRGGGDPIALSSRQPRLRPTKPTTPAPTQTYNFNEPEPNPEGNGWPEPNPEGNGWPEPKPEGNGWPEPSYVGVDSIDYSNPWGPLPTFGNFRNETD